MSALDTFAKLLGLPRHQAEDALYSESAAHAVLSRRSFFAASAALATSTVYAPSCDLYVDPWADARWFASRSALLLPMLVGAMGLYALGATKEG